MAEATKRGLGSALLRNPRKLARLVAGIAEGIDLPLTVKVRTGTSASKINVQQVVRLLKDAGAAAVIIHGRTAEQRCWLLLHPQLPLRFFFWCSGLDHAMDDVVKSLTFYQEPVLHRACCFYRAKCVRGARD